jgi:endonuclease/exonuclease/phosphatase family metal-dependent hydrolase
MRRKSILPVIIFLISIIALFVAGTATCEELKVVTINVWSGLDYNGTIKMGRYETKEVRMSRYQLLVNEIRELDPDVICINEANPLPRFARKLARDLKMDYISYINMGGIHIGVVGIPVNFRHGDAILAKKELKLKSLGKKKVSGGGIITNFFIFHLSEARQVMGGVIIFAGKKMYIFNAHIHPSLPNKPSFIEKVDAFYNEGKLTKEELTEAKTEIVDGAKRRIDEVKGILSWISETVPKDAPVILAGDFNAEVDTEEMRQIIDFGFIDTFAEKNPETPGLTWDPDTNRNIISFYSSGVREMNPVERLDNLSPYRIDFIFASGGIAANDIVKSKVVFDKEVGGQHPSDHYGVMSVIMIK